MKSILTVGFLGALVFSSAGLAAPRDELLAHYATTAKQTSASFSGFSATRGEKLYVTKFTSGKAETPSCTHCHTDNPRSVGRTPTGKTIEPVALSASPMRYNDPIKVEKWFKRNCNEVLGRECTPLEKGDWLSYMISL